MITEVRIYEAIRRVLENNFENIAVKTKDVVNVERPSFYIKFDTNWSTKLTQKIEKNYTKYKITYFGQDSELVVLLDIKEKLELFFKKPLKIIKTGDELKDSFVEITNIKTSFVEENYTLVCEIRLCYTQRISIENPTDNEYYNQQLIEEMEE